MRFEEFFEEIRANAIELSFDRTDAIAHTNLSNEAMFHLPLLAITILMLSKSRSKPNVETLGQLIGECFERTFTGFQGSAQHLGWSATLRVRTIQALSFLEIARLVEVGSQSKAISATQLGQTVIKVALSNDSDLRQALYSFERSYRNLRAERQLELQ